LEALELTRKFAKALSSLTYTGLAGILALSLSGHAVAQDTQEDVTAACQSGTNMPQAVCECIGEESEDLTPEQRAFYVATLSNDEAETARLRGELEFSELAEVTTFFRTAPAGCVG